jgi:hypothetical protein
MSKDNQRKSPSLLPALPLLITESTDEFACVRDAFDQELKPRGIIDQIFVADVAYLTWEILRLRRCKSGIINSAYLPALENLLGQLMQDPATAPDSITWGETQVEANELARGWFSDQKAKKKQILELLSNFQLDESAIEAGAIRNSAADLERLDRLLASLESRRNKALRCIADYRDSLARQLRDSSDRIIDGKVLELEKPSSKESSAAA